MAKISQVSAKYIVHSTIDIEGVVDRPDVVGAIFGQTEGLLGSDLELRELQRSGRIGRIEVNVETRAGKTTGAIIVPSSLDKAETCIIGAALEIIQRIGPCNAKIKVTKIEDVRISKRSFVIDRAKELLKTLADTVLPDSQELADEVAYSVRVMEIREYGRDRLPAGPSIDDSEEIILVEGRADVLNLLKHGFKNVIAMNGSSVPQTIIDLSKRKIMCAFVDGDRGGDLNVQELIQVAELDFVTKAPDGKEVEELTQKELHKCLRSKISAEQAKLDFANKRPMPRPSASHQAVPQRRSAPVQNNSRAPPQGRQPLPKLRSAPNPRFVRKPALSEPEKATFKKMLEDLIGTRGAYILDPKLNILGKVPVTELVGTIKSLTSGVHAIILDGIVDKVLVATVERSEIKYIVGMDSKVKESRITILTAEALDK
ncbi:DNA primase [Candidatus Woesearchaeota archaeon]|jgi:DNA primase|nr:DNA primase [Candidatus Woesearchaeota archaeon]